MSRINVRDLLKDEVVRTYLIIIGVFLLILLVLTMCNTKHTVVAQKNFSEQVISPTHNDSAEVIEDNLSDDTIVEVEDVINDTEEITVNESINEVVDIDESKHEYEGNVENRYSNEFEFDEVCHSKGVVKFVNATREQTFYYNNDICCINNYNYFDEKRVEWIKRTICFDINTLELIE